MYTSGVQCITQNKNSHQTPLNKTLWLSNNIKPAFLRVWCLSKIETNQNILLYWKKKSNVKTESTQQTKEIWQVLDSEYATIINNNKLTWFPRWFQLADLKTFFLGKQNKCIDIFTENVYFRIELWNGNNKRSRTLHRIYCFHTRSIIETLGINCLELKHLILFLSSIPYVSSTLFDNPTQCLTDFKTQTIYSIFTCEWVLLNGWAALNSFIRKSLI